MCKKQDKFQGSKYYFGGEWRVIRPKYLVGWQKIGGQALHNLFESSPLYGPLDSECGLLTQHFDTPSGNG